MKAAIPALILGAALVSAGGCANNAEIPAGAAAGSAAPAPPPFMSPAKAGNNGGGAALLVGPKPPGSTWALGPPQVGGKVKND